MFACCMEKRLARCSKKVNSAAQVAKSKSDMSSPKCFSAKESLQRCLVSFRFFPRHHDGLRNLDRSCFCPHHGQHLDEVRGIVSAMFLLMLLWMWAYLPVLVIWLGDLRTTVNGHFNGKNIELNGGFCSKPAGNYPKIEFCRWSMSFLNHRHRCTFTTLCKKEVGDVSSMVNWFPFAPHRYCSCYWPHAVSGRYRKTILVGPSFVMLSMSKNVRCTLRLASQSLKSWEFWHTFKKMRNSCGLCL